MSSRVSRLAAAAIEVGELRKTLRRPRAVDGVSFAVEAGEFFGILGPERRRQDHHAGDDRGAAPARRRRGRGCSASRRGRATRELLPRIGVQLQASAFFERLTAREQIRTFASLYGVPAARADEWLERVGLDRQGRHPHREAVRRPGAAAVDRLRAGARPRGGLPRRADRRARPAGPAQPVGPAALAQRATAAPSC